jgi:hypothetical protein
VRVCVCGSELYSNVCVHCVNLACVCCMLALWTCLLVWNYLCAL